MDGIWKNTAYSKFLEVLLSQAAQGIADGNWKDVRKFEVRPNLKEKTVDVIIHNKEIGFTFSLDGRFLGIWNWR